MTRRCCCAALRQDDVAAGAVGRLVRGGSGRGGVGGLAGAVGHLLHADGEVGYERGDGADGGPYGQEHGTDHADDERDLDEDLALVVLDGDAADVALAHELLHLAHYRLAGDSELLGDGTAGLLRSLRLVGVPLLVVHPGYLSSRRTSLC